MHGKSLALVAARIRRRVWGVRRRLRLLPRDNLAYNRELWELYARSWDDVGFRETQLDPQVPPSVHARDLRVLGEEWSASADIDSIVAEFIAPFVSPESRVAEIGVGGGRVAVRVAPRVAQLVCLDISPNMLRRARSAISESNVEFVLLDGPRLPRDLAGRLDFIYSFDVFLHLDLHTMWKYIQEMSLALRPGGKALVHTTNLAAPAGWEMFAEQDHYSVEDGYFVSPEIVTTLVSHTDLRTIKESSPDPGNLYLNRDYLVVLEKPGTP